MSVSMIVVATDTPSRHHNGVALFYRLSPRFAVEAVRKYRLNLVSFELAKGVRRWYIIGYYLAPDDTLMIECFVAVLKYRRKGTAVVVAGGLNTELEDPENNRRGT